MSENVYNVGLPPRRHMGGGTITPSVSETSGLTRTRHFGSASSVVNSISQAASLVRPRTLYNDHLAVWTSGVYVRLDLPATPISLQDRADPSKWVFQVTNTGSATFKGSVSGAGFVGGSIDIPDTTTANSFHVASDGKHWSGTNASNYATAPFRVSAAGALVATSATITGAIVGTSIDIPDTTTTSSFHVDTTGHIWSGANVANVANALFDVTAAGALSARTANFYPKDNSSKALVVTNDKSSSANLTEWIDGSTLATRVTAHGTLETQNPINIYRSMSDSQPSTVLNSTTSLLGFGPGGSTIIDVKLQRQAANILALGSISNTSGNALRFDSMTAPGSPSATEGLVQYDEAGVLKWKNNGGTVYDLSKTLDILTTTGDIAYASGANTPARLAANTTATNKFLRSVSSGAPSWQQPAFGDITGSVAASQMPAFTGDVTTSAGAVATTIANDAVVYAKMQNVSATSRILGRKTAGAGDPEELTATDVGGMMVATDLPTHGAAQHTDVTRSVWIPAPMFLSLAGTAASVGTTPNAAAVYQLATGATQGFGFVFRLPDDAAVVAPTYYIYWEGSTTEVSKIIDFRRTYLDVTDTAGNLIDAGGTTNTHATSSASITAKQPNVTASNTVVPVGSVVAGDIYRIVIRRFTGGSDTYGGTVEVIGVLVQYTATG